MNKQELIEQIKGLKSVFDNKTKYIEKNTAIELVSRLDKPQKVTIPQFVAGWIDYFKKYSGFLYGSIAPYSYYGHAITDDFVGDVKKTLGWIRNNSETYARAWLDGYEVEEEERYRVRFKGFNHRYIILKYDKYDKTWFVGGELEFEFYRAEHTRKELEDAGFSWVFNCPGIEVEEVEECKILF